MEQMEHVHLLINVSVMKLTKEWNAQKVSYSYVLFFSFCCCSCSSLNLYLLLCLLFFLGYCPDSWCAFGGTCRVSGVNETAEVVCE